jgi:hypothetical protein
MSAALVIKEIKSKARPEKVEAAQRFFKTKKGEYGYGDFFLGLSVPQVRAIAKANRGLGSTGAKITMVIIVSLAPRC